MNNSLFGLTIASIKKVFGFYPPLKGTSGSAVTAISGHFTGIGTIMLEGGVTPELGAVAIEKLFEAQQAVNAAVAYGWNGGNTSQY